METRLIAFRCPVELIEKMDQLATAVQSNRTAVILESIRLLSRQARKRGGHVIPPYTEAAVGELCFTPRPRQPRGRRRKQA